MTGPGRVHVRITIGSRSGPENSGAWRASHGVVFGVTQSANAHLAVGGPPALASCRGVAIKIAQRSGTSFAVRVADPGARAVVDLHDVSTRIRDSTRT